MLVVVFSLHRALFFVATHLGGVGQAPYSRAEIQSVEARPLRGSDLGTQRMTVVTVKVVESLATTSNPENYDVQASPDTARPPGCRFYLSPIIVR